MNETVAELSHHETHSDLDKRLTIQEVKMDTLTEAVVKIRDNHLPHLQSKLDSVHDRVTFGVGAIAVGTFLFPLLLQYIFK